MLDFFNAPTLISTCLGSFLSRGVSYIVEQPSFIIIPFLSRHSSQITFFRSFNHIGPWYYYMKRIPPDRVSNKSEPSCMPPIDTSKPEKKLRQEIQLTPQRNAEMNTPGQCAVNIIGLLSQLQETTILLILTIGIHWN